MPHTFVTSYYHCVFSTKNRRELITDEIENRLYPYLGGIAKSGEMKLLAVGGMPDHLHLLLSMPTKLPLAKAIQTLKGNSSHWLNKNFDVPGRFEWQTGYGAFSIAAKDIPKTRSYINNQKQHHKKMDSDTEFNAFLRKNGVGR